jgi:DNA-binding transcriptional regulator YiaG
VGEKMPRPRPIPSDKHDIEIVARIAYGQKKYAVNNENLAIYLHMSKDTLNRRMKDPTGFTLAEMRVLKRKLNIEFDEVI